MFREAIINRCGAYYQLCKTGIGGYAKINNNEPIHIYHINGIAINIHINIENINNIEIDNNLFDAF